MPLAARGIRVAGIDLSPDMVAQLRKKTDEIPVAIGDMSTTRVDGTFSLVYIVFNSINNVTTQDGQVACSRTRRRTSTRAAASSSRSASRTTQRLEGRSTSSDTHVGVDELDFDTQRLVSHHFSLVDGEWRRASMPFRSVSPAELDLMARLAGMELRERWADWDRSPFTAESTKHVSVWEKPRMRIELPIETERLVIRPLRIEDAADLGEPEEWIREKIDRFERDGGMSLWAAVERESRPRGRARRPAVGADRRPPRARSRLRRRDRCTAARLRDGGVGGRHAAPRSPPASSASRR